MATLKADVHLQRIDRAIRKVAALRKTTGGTHDLRSLQLDVLLDLLQRESELAHQMYRVVTEIQDFIPDSTDDFLVPLEELAIRTEGMAVKLQRAYGTGTMSSGSS